MPVNHNESAVAGTKWSRCSAVHIQNRYNEVPTIHVQEEQIMAIEGLPPQIVSSRPFSQPFDPAAVIALRNPDTDALTGATITQGEVYSILYSLYRQMTEQA